jgi:signal transduction histidine kinase
MEPKVIRADAVLVGPRPGYTPLDVLRRLRSQAADLPVILFFQQNDADAAVAAFKLGAQDFILEKPDYLTELMFSLTHVLNRTALTRHNVQLSSELETVNRSLEAQVALRTSELESLSFRFISVREDERRAVARELHDDIGQLLTGLKMQLEAAAAEARPQVAERLRVSLEGVTRLMERTRDLTLRLRPLILDDLGLQPAIEWHLNLFQKQTEIAVESEFLLPAGRLSDELETTIFRVVQEALTNVARHSGSPTAHVMVMVEDRQIVAEIADRGRGFDIEAVRARQNSLGLVGITERARLVGGSLEIISIPGRGTRVHATFPLLLAALIA